MSLPPPHGPRRRSAPAPRAGPLPLQRAAVRRPSVVLMRGACAAAPSDSRKRRAQGQEQFRRHNPRLSRACYHLALHRFWLTFGPKTWKQAREAGRPQAATMAGKLKQMTDELRYYGRQAQATGASATGKADDGRDEGVPMSIGVGGATDQAAARSGGSQSAVADAREEDLTSRFQRFGVKMGETYKWQAPAGDRVRGAVASNGARFVMRYPPSFDPDDPARVRALQEAGVVDDEQAAEQLRDIRARRLAQLAGDPDVEDGDIQPEADSASTSEAQRTPVLPPPPQPPAAQAPPLPGGDVAGSASGSAASSLYGHAMAELLSPPARSWHTRLGSREPGEDQMGQLPSAGDDPAVETPGAAGSGAFALSRSGAESAAHQAQGSTEDVPGGMGGEGGGEERQRARQLRGLAGGGADGDGGALLSLLGG